MLRTATLLSALALLAACDQSAMMGTGAAAPDGRVGGVGSADNPDCIEREGPTAFDTEDDREPVYCPDDESESAL